MDVFKAHQEVERVIAAIASARDEEAVFSSLYTRMGEITNLRMPHTAGRQTQRANPDVADKESYIKVSFYLA